MLSSLMEGREHQLPIATTTTTATSAKAQTKVLDSVVAMKAMSKLGGFHAGYFRISLSLCGQALLWKTLSEPSTDSRALRLVVRLLPSATYVLVWSVALAVLVALCFLYALRCFLRFRCVKAEFSHHVGVNYLFAPWISWLLLLQSTPAFLHPGAALYRVLWWVFSVPILMFDVKIYGQWFTEGKKFLSMVANPTSQITVIGNLVCARAAARMGWEEIATCMFSLGMAHYLVLFVTLYQRFVGCNSLPAMLRPVFFLFIAAPSMASLAWDSISGSFGLAACSVQEVDEAVQRCMVGVLLPADGAGAGGHRVRTGGGGKRLQRPHARPRRPLRAGHRRPHRLHRDQGRRPPSPRQ
ncbi:S-type anion channel SLAH1-like isoform X2 [Musa acuminata AAA Group]|uniref:S-type anion channel SLAH1-like isoform X2 n=1 Tax=Musa acuminata AAA Group TaxID=214697 RepID=UPI0031DEF32B